jgi:hypothetical protein
MPDVHSPSPDEMGSGAPEPTDRFVIERLYALGLAVVPLQPSQQMLEAGAPLCFQPAEAQSAETWGLALSDAAACYRAMVAAGRL